jgi:hypothetical protein
MVLLFLSVSFRPYPKNWRYFGVKMFGTGWDTTGLHEQSGFWVIDTKTPFYTQNNDFEK